ncbi:hypothetical protein AURDEDRAFT_117234 [Auricularia subglabra TFB-10046 SS5]|nr:hypothetical protein AURDEDRAFT_117234 [Auricularia subglabra TFB-10046 SS5]
MWTELGNGQRISPGGSTFYDPATGQQHVYAQQQQQPMPVQQGAYSMPTMNGMYHPQQHPQQHQQQPVYPGGALGPAPLLTTAPLPARGWDPNQMGYLHQLQQPQDRNATPPRACVRCKRLKVRCENVNGTRPCKRCLNAKHECVTAQRKQRPKKGEHRVGDKDANKSSPSVGERTPDSPSESSSEAEYAEEDDAGGPGTGDTVLAPFAWIKESALEKKEKKPSDQPSPSSAAKPASSKKVGISRSWFVGQQPQNEKNEKMEIMAIVTPSEVETLFKSFMDKINPYMSMFDEKLHTFQAVRAKSPFLLTVIVTIAARYYTTRPDAYVRLMDVTKKMAGEAIVNTTKSIEHCQAFILLASYPAPDRKYSENRNWLYSGVAFRMATDLSLHRPPPKAPVPSDEMLEREYLNRTRTWIVCFYLDESMSAHFGRPATIARDDAVVRNAMSWWRRSPYNHPHDLHLCLFVELLRIFRRYLDRGQDAEDAESLGEPGAKLDYFAMSREFDEEVRAWEATAQGLFEQTDRKNPIIILRERLCDFTTQYARLIIHSTGFQKGQPVPEGGEDVCLVRCLDAAFRVLEIVMRDIHSTGTLRYGCDGYFWYCSFASAFLLKFLGPDHREKVDEATRAKIVSYVQELIGVLSSRDVAVDASHPPKLFSRFLSGMLAKHVKQAASATPQPPTPVTQSNASPVTDRAPTPALTASSPVEPAQLPQQQQQDWQQQQQFAGFENYEYDYPPQQTLYASAEQDEMMKDVSPHELNTGMFILDHPPWWHDPTFSMDLSSLDMGSGGAGAQPPFDMQQQQQQQQPGFAPGQFVQGGTAAFQM